MRAVRAARAACGWVAPISPSSAEMQCSSRNKSTPATVIAAHLAMSSSHGVLRPAARSSAGLARLRDAAP